LEFVLVIKYWFGQWYFNYKMFNGHRGNHPVKNLLTGKGEVTSQNHGFAVNKEELIIILI
jgi:carbamoylphosphate synthase small subunit